jgi:DNA-binding response OmpR family regulator
MSRFGNRPDTIAASMSAFVRQRFFTDAPIVASVKLLHVEDDPGFCQFVADALRGPGVSLEWCGTGDEALKRLREHPTDYDLVILDLVLPYLNGLQVLSSIRSAPETATLPVLITTGTLVFRKAFEGDQPVALLRKPFDAEDLVEAIETLLDTGDRSMRSASG